MGLEIRDVRAKGSGTSFTTVIFAIIFGFFAVFLFATNKSILINVAICLAGLIVFIYLNVRDERNESKKDEAYEWSSCDALECLECKKTINEPVKHIKKQGQPVIFHCEGCEILWYTGSYWQST